MNDPSEFLLVHDIIKEELKAYREKDRAFYDLISDYNQIEKAIKCSEEMYSSNDDIFILSFTRKCDSLNMWTCYSKAGHPDGYSITFKEPFRKILKDEERMQYIRFSVSELRENETRECIVIKETGNESFRVSSDELLLAFRQRRYRPDFFPDEGECWSFFMEVETGIIYKAPTNAPPMLTLKRVQD